MNKFSNIQFPLFGKDHLPVSIVYGYNTIYINEPDTSSYLVDDKFLPQKSYFKRLIQLKKQKDIKIINYDYTVRNLQELLQSKPVWGIDNTGKVFKFDKKQAFKCRTVKVKKIKKNLVWVKTVSYPFEIKNNLHEGITKFLFVTLVNINNVWYLYKFSYKNSKKREIYI